MFSSNTSAANGAANYIEDVFSTWLYTGTGASQTHTNNIDLAGKGGLVWLKRRSGVESHYLQDSSSSFANSLSTNSTAAQITGSGVITAVSSTGFTTSSVSSGTTYASWTFRKQPKFFDVVTFTSDGTNTQQISHSLASVPGCIILKRTNSTGNWIVWHRGDGTTDRYTFSLNNTSAANSSGSTFVATGKISSTIFSPNYLEDYLGNRPVSGGTYVAYLFAHDAGGFGLTGTDNVISCGSYTGNGSATGPTVTLGYEPQWLLTKRTDLSADWQLVDTMRGMSSAYNRLFPNSSAVEDFESDGVTPTATGFKLTGVQPTHNASGGTYIYIAIRRGPMKVPTSGTSVFDDVIFNGGSSSITNSLSFTPDASILEYRSSWNYPIFTSRLTGKGKLIINQTDAENTSNTDWVVTDFDNTNAIKYNDYTGGNLSSRSGSWISWNFKRAPSFFDEVCYTGTGAARTVTHNLGVAPELMITKSRSLGGSAVYNWWSYAAPLGNGQAVTLNTTDASAAASIWNYTSPTASVFSLAGSTLVNTSGATYVAYLFATCAGVSKCTAFTGNGTSQTINCGFTSGARFVMIKATSTTGNWTIFDSARGISAGGDPALYLNSTAAEVTGVDAIDADSTGFIVNQESTFNLNASGVQYLVLAIA